MVLGPSMTYSCAVFASADDTLEIAQRRKVDLICRKLDLQPGMRLLDVGCGWGAMAIHAARHYGVSVVGVTLSDRATGLRHRRARELGVGELCEFRLQDYRDVRDGPFDAISSIGMSEHVGRRSLAPYAQQMFDLLKPGRALPQSRHRATRLDEGRPSTHATRRSVASDPDRLGDARSVAGAAATSSSATSSPTANSTTWARWCHSSRPTASRCATSRACASTTRMTLRHWVDNLVKRFDEAVEEVGVAASARLATLHGRFRGQLRTPPPRDPSGAHGQARSRAARACRGDSTSNQTSRASPAGATCVTM